MEVVRNGKMHLSLQDPAMSLTSIDRVIAQHRRWLPGTADTQNVSVGQLQYSKPYG